ncbi:MAG: T9SS type A sorting domain-containing protein [Candidatus Zixiibacteriota bacterium]
MKKNWIVIVLTIFLLLAAVPSFSQHLMMRATCADTAGFGYIAAGSDFAIEIEMFNDYGAIYGGSFPLAFFSPNDSATASHLNVTGGMVVVNVRGGGNYASTSIESLNGWNSLFSLLSSYSGFSWDGSLPDTINWTGATMGSYPADADFVARLRFNFTAGNTNGRICVDSCSVPGVTPPGTYDWLWDDVGAYFVNGPYCWDITVVEAVKEINNDNMIPVDFNLDQNYPNPFNPTTNIKFAIKNRTNVNISIFNILGQKVATLADREFNAGYYEATWDGTDDNGSIVASGMYFYRLEADEFTDTKKMIMLK